MIADVPTLACENLLTTYFSLAKASRKTRISTEKGYRLCYSEIDHPICNFAADLNLDPNVAMRLSALSLEKSSFHVYQLPSDRPKHASELLYSAGFKKRQSLSQMICTDLGDEGLEIGAELVIAISRADRGEISAFMMRNFFARQSNSFRREVALATQGAEGLDLYWAIVGGITVGAVMVCEGESVLGIYNLCVESRFRGRGYGEAILNILKILALRSGKVPVLQCDSRLVDWYAKQKFAQIGSIEVFGTEY